MDIHKLIKDGITYSIAMPGHPQNLFVKYYLACHGYPVFAEEYVLPNNQAEVFFNLGDPCNGGVKGGDELFTFDRTVVSGLRSQRLTIKPSGVYSLAGIRFTLFGFHSLFGIPVNEFTNKTFSASDVWNNSVHGVWEQLMEAVSTAQRIATLDEWILGRIDAINIQEAKLWNKLIPGLTVLKTSMQDHLASVIGYSHKHTVKLFKEKCGLPPKLIQRVYRFNQCMLQMHEPNLNWISVCYKSGYYDQSHFIKDFKTFTGFTPEQFLETRPEDTLLLHRFR